MRIRCFYVPSWCRLQMVLQSKMGKLLFGKTFPQINVKKSLNSCMLKRVETRRRTRASLKLFSSSLTWSVRLLQQPVAIEGWQWGFIVDDQILPCQISERTRLWNYHVYTATSVRQFYSGRTLEHLFEETINLRIIDVIRFESVKYWSMRIHRFSVGVRLVRSATEIKMQLWKITAFSVGRIIPYFVVTDTSVMYHVVNIRMKVNKLVAVKNRSWSGRVHL